MTWSEIWPLLQEASVATAIMVGVSGLFATVFGLLFGVLLVLTDRDGLFPLPILNKLLGGVVNVGRSLPFIILMIAIVPFTKLVTGGSSIGTEAMIVPLAVGAVPFYARLVETALREVDPGVVAAARAMGASGREIVWKVLLREARPGLLAGLTVTVIALVGYSAMAGTIGGGGLGDVAVQYGYERFETKVMISTVVLLVVVVQLVQMLGDWAARRLSHK
ncbi:ABC transporter permease [Actinomadura kijaniata]|uniref:D-methionine transport system permease protein n=1 Tax=Actinomadura namibiensis TaxID=182080 RepID=A0A7W3LP87_ACTNM|nr:methionine ABC transporter permease [Actinomadura namibiensis]MBA8951768.1 D-methionine transport system permease protein [Actinomadura namibiensis]